MKALNLVPGDGPTREHIRLITAAPQMLEALKFALPLIGHPDDAEYIASVIAKATEPHYDRH